MNALPGRLGASASHPLTLEEGIAWVAAGWVVKIAREALSVFPCVVCQAFRISSEKQKGTSWSLPCCCRCM